MPNWWWSTTRLVELRDSLSQLQSEQTQLAAQYELAYDLQAIEQQMLASGEMIQVQDWQTYTLELAEPDTVEYYQARTCSSRSRLSFRTW